MKTLKLKLRNKKINGFIFTLMFFFFNDFILLLLS